MTHGFYTITGSAYAYITHAAASYQWGASHRWIPLTRVINGRLDVFFNVRQKVISWKHFLHYWLVVNGNPPVTGWFRSQKASHDGTSNMSREKGKRVPRRARPGWPLLLTPDPFCLVLFAHINWCVEVSWRKCYQHQRGLPACVAILLKVHCYSGLVFVRFHRDPA